MKIELITFTRFLAAVLVISYHYGENCIIFNNKYLNFIFEQGFVAVSYFFVLSGFIMTVVYAKRKINTREFLINRFARIYPVYIISLLFFFILTNRENYGDLALNLLAIQTWVKGKAISLNSPGWSISVEFFFYLVFPYLIHLFKNQKLKFIIYGVFTFWLVSQILFYIFHTTPNQFYNEKFLPIFHLNEFLIGILFGFIYLKKYKLYFKNTFLILSTSLIFITLYFAKPLSLNIHNGLLAIIFAIFILYLSENNSPLKTFFSKKVFIFLGEISFSMYLLQKPIWLLVTDYRINKFITINKSSTGDETKLFITKLIILIIVSSITYLFIENPLRKLIKTKYN